MNKDNTLITIGITCFNAVDTISRAIESAQAQNWPNIEIVIVDDGSSDDSVRTILNQIESDPRIKLLRHPENRGFPAALNTIIDNAKGMYIAFFDDDDESDRTRITKQYNRITNFSSTKPNEPVVCYTGRRVFVNGVENGTVKAIGHVSPEPHGSLVADHLLLRRSPTNFVWGALGSGTMMASRSVFNDFKFDTAFRRSAEWDFAVRVAMKNGWFIAVNEPLLMQHVSVSEDKSGTKPLTYNMMLRRKHQAYLKSKKAYLAALATTYAQFYFTKGKRIGGVWFVICAKLLAPHILFKDFVIKWLP